MEAGVTLQGLPEDPVSRRGRGRNFSGEGIQNAPSDRRTIHGVFLGTSKTAAGKEELHGAPSRLVRRASRSHLASFRHEPGLRPVEKQSLARWIGEKAEPEEKNRCVADGVNVLQRTSGISPKGVKVGHIIDHFLSHELKLLAADKKGGFVVAPLTLYSTRTRQAIDRNFMLVNPGALTKV
ncbi:hypothetical protein HPB47_023710 [Ixodes persulcatus]|uniref:Uncharacterized protein n=1 Tax=Ixodes persulcatus TaxID=34615 RepID=A0AC60Q7F7_IXOPE|nr:hypothetical protein HPB47_023710 [Ixodes persulcatus]